MGKDVKNKTKSENLEDTNLNEPKTQYAKKYKKLAVDSSEYITIEEFRAEAKKRARKLLKEHGIH